MNLPAFPVPMIPVDKDGGFTDVRCSGMTLRDYFAAAALTGLAANEGLAGEQSASATKDFRSIDAKRCYAMADAMLVARQKQPS